MSRVAIALGSNIDPEQNLPLAVARIGEVARLLRVSTVWESAPFGYSEQSNFLNAAVLVETNRAPRELKAELLRIEEELGRVRDPRNKNGPRTIDLDIALYGVEVHEDDGLAIPDPEIPLRSFLAVPLAELQPWLIHPILGQPLSVIARAAAQDNSLTPRPDVVLTRSSENRQSKPGEGSWRSATK